jgi:hypothetical protein
MKAYRIGYICGIFSDHGIVRETVDECGSLLGISTNADMDLAAALLHICHEIEKRDLDIWPGGDGEKGNLKGKRRAIYAFLPTEKREWTREQVGEREKRILTNLVYDGHFDRETKESAALRDWETIYAGGAALQLDIKLGSSRRGHRWSR